MDRTIAEVKRFLRRSALREECFFNEAELQHELGFWLRRKLPSGTRVHFERPAASFFPSAIGLVKKEIDLVISPPNNPGRMAIELKCPRNGQFPEMMFSACRDLQFLEQLVAKGFAAGLFLIHVNTPGFYQIGLKRGIYAHFRGGKPLPAIIRKPTGIQNQVVRLTNRYCVKWEQCGEFGRYWLQLVQHGTCVKSLKV